MSNKSLLDSAAPYLSKEEINEIILNTLFRKGSINSIPEESCDKPETLENKINRLQSELEEAKLEYQNSQSKTFTFKIYKDISVNAINERQATEMIETIIDNPVELNGYYMDFNCEYLGVK